LAVFGRATNRFADQLQENPAAARATFRVKVRLHEGPQCSALVCKFPALVIDEPPYLGGNDAGPSPVEILLVLLGADQEIAYSIFVTRGSVEALEFTAPREPERLLVGSSFGAAATAYAARRPDYAQAAVR
jgi:hypothetical protein